MLSVVTIKPFEKLELASAQSKFACYQIYSLILVMLQILLDAVGEKLVTNDFFARILEYIPIFWIFYR